MSRTIKTTSYNVRPDRHTTTSLNNLQPEDGVIVFDKDSKQNKYHNGTEWVNMGGGTSPFDTRGQGFIDYNDTTGSISLVADIVNDVP